MPSSSIWDKVASDMTTQPITPLEKKTANRRRRRIRVYLLLN
jgi:hypothetical protein